jgi:large subunit ribosomal protein L35
MPKLKTHSGTKDRIKITKNGKVQIGHAGGNHLLQKKSAARKRRIGDLNTVSGAVVKSIKQNLGV